MLNYGTPPIKVWSQIADLMEKIKSASIKNYPEKIVPMISSSSSLDGEKFADVIPGWLIADEMGTGEPGGGTRSAPPPRRRRHGSGPATSQECVGYGSFANLDNDL